MTTYYIDDGLVSGTPGSDAAAGTSWGAAWLTITSGATAARIAPGDTIRIAKSPAPVSIGNGTWTDGPLASTRALVSSTNATPIVVTDTAHPYVNGDIIQITGHATNTAANGVWVVANKTANTYELTGSVGNGVGGATGTARLINNKCVYLATAQTANVDLCETVWTATTGLITVLNGTPTAGGTGYTVNDVLTITTGGTGAQATVTTVSGGVVTAVTLLKGGNGGYTTGTGKATTGGTGTGCTLNITTVASATAALVAAATDAKEGENSFRCTAPSAVKAGTLLAYRAISPGSLTAYQKLSFWIKNNSVITANTEWRLCLCSDAAGATVVDEFVIPAIPSVSRWLPLTITKTGGGNLGASTASIAIYTNTLAPASASNILVDNFIACTTSGLNLQSLISKNSLEAGGTEGWYGIQSINGKFVLLDNDTNCTSVSANGRGYSGTTATVTTYIRETIKTAMAASSVASVNTINDSGTLAGGNITFSGGWTPSGSQDGESIFDGLNGNGTGLVVSSVSFVTVERVSAIRYGVATGVTGCISCRLSGLLQCNNSLVGVSFSTGACANVVAYDFTLANASGGWSIAGGGNICTALRSSDNIGPGVTLGGTNSLFTAARADNNSTFGVTFSGSRCRAAITSMTGNATAQATATQAANPAVLKDSTLNGTEWDQASATIIPGRLFSQNHDATGYDWMFTDGGTVNSEATTFTGKAGKMWRLAVTSSSRASNYPLDFQIAKIACAAKIITVLNATPTAGGTGYTVGDTLDIIQAGGHGGKATVTTVSSGVVTAVTLLRGGSDYTAGTGKATAGGTGTGCTLDITTVADKAVTVTALMKKTHATNVVGRLVCRGGQIAGVAADVTDTLASDTSEHTLSISFTPTAGGVVEIEAWAEYSSGNADVLVDSITVAQAA